MCAAVTTLMLGCAVGPVWGQAGDKVYPLHGMVVNGLTGKPVARALVKSPDGQLATMTDGEGRFRVELHVPPGAPTMGSGPAGDGGYLYLVVEKPGYLPKRQPTSLPIDSTLGDAEVKLVLMPTARIVGQVLASGVDAAAGVSVELSRRSVGADGRFRWVQGDTSATNSRGEFHFSNLPPGVYSVMTMQWNGDELLAPDHDAERKIYPAAFLGSATSVEGATKLHLGYGESVRAELHIEAKTFYPVTIPVPDATGMVSMRVSGAPPEWSQDEPQFVARERAIRGWMPDGAYTLILSSNGDQTMGAVVNLNVADGPVRTKPITLKPDGRIEVRVHNLKTKVEPAQPEPGNDEKAVQGNSFERSMPPVRLYLMPETGPDQGVRATGEDMSLRGVDPGKYFVLAQVNAGYAAVIRSGGVDLLQDALVVSASGSAEPIDVTLRDDTATASGGVTGGSGTMSRRSSIFFVPTDAHGQFQMDMAGMDGKYSAKDLVPGSYTVFAVAGVELLPYRDADFMEPLRSKGVAVSLAPNQAVELDVPLLEVAVPEELQTEEITID